MWYERVSISFVRPRGPKSAQASSNGWVHKLGQGLVNGLAQAERKLKVVVVNVQMPVPGAAQDGRAGRLKDAAPMSIPRHTSGRCREPVRLLEVGWKRALAKMRAQMNVFVEAGLERATKRYSLGGDLLGQRNGSGRKADHAPVWLGSQSVVRISREQGPVEARG